MTFLDTLRALDKAATPAPWLHKHDDEDTPTSDVIDYNGDFVAFASADDEVGCHDAAIIALLRTHAARLAAVVEAAGAVVASWYGNPGDSPSPDEAHAALRAAIAALDEVKS